MTRPITVAKATETRTVELTEDGTPLLYNVRPITRSVKRSILESQQRLDKLAPEDPLKISDEEEQAAMRALCDLIDVFLQPQDDKQRAAGDVLYDAWMDDVITEDAVGDLLTSLLPATDPPR